MVKPDLKLRTEQRLRFSDVDANFQRLAYWSDNWVAGVSEANEVVRHEGGTWVCILTTTDEPSLSSADWSSMNLPGSGGLRMAAPIAMADIGAPWSSLDQMDTQALATYGMTLDLVNGQWSFLFEGLWQLSIVIGFSHNSDNGGRTTQLRLQDITAAATIGTVTIGVGRNVEDTFVAIPILSRFAAANLGNVMELQIGNGDSITGVTMNNLSLNAVQLGV